MLDIRLEASGAITMGLGPVFVQSALSRRPSILQPGRPGPTVKQVSELIGCKILCIAEWCKQDFCLMKPLSRVVGLGV